MGGVAGVEVTEAEVRGGVIGEVQGDGGEGRGRRDSGHGCGCCVVTKLEMICEVQELGRDLH